MGGESVRFEWACSMEARYWIGGFPFSSFPGDVMRRVTAESDECFPPFRSARADFVTCYLSRLADAAMMDWEILALLFHFYYR